jgi:hypothetical protein
VTPSLDVSALQTILSWAAVSELMSAAAAAATTAVSILVSVPRRRIATRSTAMAPQL